jgi:hypothetical protein
MIVPSGTILSKATVDNSRPRWEGEEVSGTHGAWVRLHVVHCKFPQGLMTDHGAQEVLLYDELNVTRAGRLGMSIPREGYA